ncbi:MAG: 50S ribosomal protein L10 [bacterium]|nr:50S ribosomal protein L10 [bacterium]
MKSKLQKKEAVGVNAKDLAASRTVIITDFTGLSVNELSVLRRTLKAMGAPYRVVKKRLLKFVFETEGMAFNPKDFAGQTGVVFSPKDMVETANAVYQVAKLHEKRGFLKILGGFDVSAKQFISAADVTAMGKLPGRQVLLGQLVGMLASPIRQFVFVLDQKSKQ